MTTIYGMETVPVENGKFDAVPYGYVEVNPLVADPNTPRVSRIVSGMVGNKSFYLKEIKDKPNVFGFELALQTVRVEIHRRRAGKRVSSHLKEMRRMRQEVEAIEL